MSTVIDAEVHKSHTWRTLSQHHCHYYYYHHTWLEECEATAFGSVSVWTRNSKIIANILIFVHS